MVVVDSETPNTHTTTIKGKRTVFVREKASRWNAVGHQHRAWRRLQRGAFASDLAASRQTTWLSCTASPWPACSTNTVRSWRRAAESIKPSTPWFDADCRESRRRARRAERHFRRTCADVDRQNWVKKTTEMRAVYEHKSNEYWRTEIAASNGNMKRLWQRLHGVGLLGEEPSGETVRFRSTPLLLFFTSKVDQAITDNSTRTTKRQNT